MPPPSTGHLRESLKKKRNRKLNNKDSDLDNCPLALLFWLKDHEARVGKEPGVKLAFCGVRKQTLTHDFVPYSGSHEREKEREGDREREGVGGVWWSFVFVRWYQRGGNMGTIPIWWSARKKREKNTIHLLCTARWAQNGTARISTDLEKCTSNQRSIWKYWTLRWLIYWLYHCKCGPIKKKDIAKYRINWNCDLKLCFKTACRLKEGLNLYPNVSTTQRGYKGYCTFHAKSAILTADVRKWVPEHGECVESASSRTTCSSFAWFTSLINRRQSFKDANVPIKKNLI